MRILLINHYAGSPHHGMAYRPFYFAREWVRSGHSVLIPAADFTHLRRVNPSTTETLTREQIEGVDYLWVKTPPYQGNGASRVRNMLTFTARLRTTSAKVIDGFEPDVVIASSTYTWDNWVASHYARRFGAHYVFEVHDLWPLTPMELGGMSRMHPFIYSLQRAEDFACANADSVVSLLPGAEPHLVEHGMPQERFIHVPNGIVRDEWEDQEPIPRYHDEALSRALETSASLVGYVGGHGLSNALDVLVEAGAGGRLEDVTLVCVGDGPEKARLMEKARASGSRVLFLPPVPKRSVPDLLRRCDALYLGWTNSPLYRFGISPNKLYEYMMAGVPVLHATGAPGDPVRAAGCGISIPPEDADSLIDAINEVTSMTPEERQMMGERGRQYVLENHDVSKLAQRFLEHVLRAGNGTKVLGSR